MLKRIVNEDPAFLPAYNSLAKLQMRQGQTSVAIQTLQDGLRVNPEYPILLNNLGMCWIVRQDNETALEMFTRASGVRPENRKYRANMAVVLGLMDRDEESLSLFTQVLPVDLANQNLAVLQKTQGGAKTGHPALIERLKHEQAESTILPWNSSPECHPFFLVLRGVSQLHPCLSP